MSKQSPKKKVDRSKVKQSSPHVPGQALGYSLQGTLFVSLLLQAPRDAKVSLEVFEDVGVETPEEKRIAVQAKSALVGNPVSDRSVELWKAFSNWIDAVAAGELDPEKTIFKIYVSKKVGGAIVESFSGAKSCQEAKTAILSARKELWGESPDFGEKKNVAATIKEHLESFFCADETLVSKIICAFELETGSGSPQSDLRELFSRSLVPDELVSDLHSFALGWVKKKTDIALEQKKSAIIAVSEFRATIQSFVQKFNTRMILRSFAKDPRPEEITAENLKTYVRQLEIIALSEDDELRAMIDYLKASVDRTQWSEKGLVIDGSFSEFEDDLVRAWDNLKTKTFLGHKDKTEEERGQLLYAECALHQAKLQHMETPTYFTSGSYHALADQLTVGWHPEFRNRLKKLISEGRLDQ